MPDDKSKAPVPVPSAKPTFAAIPPGFDPVPQPVPASIPNQPSPNVRVIRRPDAAPPVVPATSPPPPPSFDPLDVDEDEVPAIPVSPPVAKPGGSAPSGPPEPTPAHRHSPRAANLARHYGFSQADLDVTAPDELLRELQAIQLEERAVSLEKARNPAPPVPPETDGIDWGEVEVMDADGNTTRRKAVETDFAPGLVKVVKAQHESNKSLKATVEALVARDTERQRRALGEAFDAGFAALGESYQGVFGEGSGMEMDQTDENFRRRMAVLHLAGIDPNKDTSATIKKKVKQTAETLYGAFVAGTTAVTPPATPPIPADPILERKRQWQEGQLAKPTARTPPKEKGKPSAIAAINGVLEQIRGRDVNNGTDDNNPFDDDLPR